MSRDLVLGGVPRVALKREEAVAALGIGLDSFERHVQPELYLIRRGRLVLVPVLGAYALGRIRGRADAPTLIRPAAVRPRFFRVTLTVRCFQKGDRPPGKGGLSRRTAR